MMTYEETLQYLYAQLPMFQRQGPKAFKKDLTNIRRLLKLLGNPHESLKAIHIAGTNGKGTVAHLIAAGLQYSGIKTGLYTSPHYRDFRERIKIDGQYISKEEVIRFVHTHKGMIETIRPSFFEITVALAFATFAERQVDIAVIETGLGGRLDSTNVIDPLISIITNISYDHQNFLGDTLTAIASEKAGIIKKGRPVVIGESLPETDRIFKFVAEEYEAPIYFAEEMIKAETLDQNKEFTTFNFSKKDSFNFHYIEVGITGPFALNNARTALAALDVMYELEMFSPLVVPNLLMAWPDIKKLTAYQGRWQWLEEKPDILCDSAHNEAGLQKVLDALRQMNYPRVHIVLGMVFDKRPEKLLKLLPQDAQYYFCKPDIPRGMKAEELQQLADTFGLKGSAWPSVKLALEAARKTAREDELIFIGGSTFTVAEAL